MVGPRMSAPVKERAGAVVTVVAAVTVKAVWAATLPDGVLTTRVWMAGVVPTGIVTLNW